MAIYPILRMGDPRLWQVSQAITEFNTPALDQLVQDLWDTMYANNGAGLAAPQIGILQRVVVFHIENNPRYPNAAPVPPTVLINPTVEMVGDEQAYIWEGCLSVPGLRGYMPRYHRLRYTGYDQYGKPFTREVTDIHARVVQHELDHLNGRLYPLGLPDLQQFGFEKEVYSAAGIAT